MDALFRATLDFRREQPAGVLRIRAPHSFAISWLLQRTATFMALNPDIEIEVTIGRGLDELRAGKIDAVIAIGPNEPHSFPQDRLIELEAAVVAAPSLLRGRAPPRHPLGTRRSSRPLRGPCAAPVVLVALGRRTGCEGLVVVSPATKHC